MPRSMLLVATLVALGAMTAPGYALCGDCNLDAQVSIIDALTAAQTAAGIVVLLGDELENCDVDATCSVNILDALRVAQFSAGLPGLLSCFATCPFSLTAPCLPAATVGTPYSQMLVPGGGTPPCTWTSGCTLPPGLMLDGASGLLSGTPTQAGEYFVTIVATCGGGCARGTYRLEVGAGPALTLPPGYASRLHVDLAASAVAQVIDLRICPPNGAFGALYAGDIFAPGLDQQLMGQAIYRITPRGEIFVFADGAQFLNPVQGGMIDILVGGVEFHPSGDYLFTAGINYNSTGVYWVDSSGTATFMRDTTLDIYCMDMLYLPSTNELFFAMLDLSRAQPTRGTVTIGPLGPSLGLLTMMSVPPASGDHCGIAVDSGGTLWVSHLDYTLGGSVGTIDRATGIYTPVSTRPLYFTPCSGIDGDIVIAPTTGIIYASVGETDPMFGNSIVAIDPVTGAVTSFATGFSGLDVYCGTVENAVPSGLVLAPATCGTGLSLFAADGDKIWEIVGAF